MSLLFKSLNTPIYKHNMNSISLDDEYNQFKNLFDSLPDDLQYNIRNIYEDPKRLVKDDLEGLYNILNAKINKETYNKAQIWLYNLNNKKKLDIVENIFLKINQDIKDPYKTILFHVLNKNRVIQLY